MPAQNLVFICPFGLGSSGSLASDFEEYLKLKKTENRFRLFQTGYEPGQRIVDERKKGERKFYRFKSGTRSIEKYNCVFVADIGFKHDIDRLVEQGIIRPSGVVYTKQSDYWRGSEAFKKDLLE